MRVLKKLLKFLVVAAIFLLSFAVGAYIFMPWESAGLYGLEIARYRASQSGARLYYDGYSERGGAVPNFALRSLNIETAFARTALTNVSIRPRPLSSAITASAAGMVSFSGGEIDLVPNIKLSLGPGRIRASVTPGMLKVEDISLTGDINLSGTLLYNLSSRKVAESTISFTVPDDLGAMLSSPILARFVERGDDGAWRIRYEAANK